MTHHTDAERAEFEAWARERYPSIDLTRGGDDYSKALAKDYWSLWQAARRAPAAPVPHGWKLVPVEPTKEMIEQACKDHGYPGGSRWVYRDGYRSMLAAAPQPPEEAPVRKPLTDAQCIEILKFGPSSVTMARAIERAHGIKD